MPGRHSALAIRCRDPVLPARGELPPPLVASDHLSSLFPATPRSPNPPITFPRSRCPLAAPLLAPPVARAPPPLSAPASPAASNHCRALGEHSLSLSLPSLTLFPSPPIPAAAILSAAGRRRGRPRRLPEKASSPPVVVVVLPASVGISLLLPSLSFSLFARRPPHACRRRVRPRAAVWSGWSASQPTPPPCTSTVDSVHGGLDPFAR